MVLKDSRLINNLLVVRHLLIHVTGKSWQVRQDKLPLQGHAHPPPLTQTGMVYYMRRLTSRAHLGMWQEIREPGENPHRCTDKVQTLHRQWPREGTFLLLLLINVIMIEQNVEQNDTIHGPGVSEIAS